MRIRVFSFWVGVFVDFIHFNFITNLFPNPEGSTTCLSRESIFFCQLKNSINIFDISSKTIKTIYTANSISAADWSPDGKQFAFFGNLVNKPTPNLYVINADGSGLITVPLPTSLQSKAGTMPILNIAWRPPITNTALSPTSEATAAATANSTAIATQGN